MSIRRATCHSTCHRLEETLKKEQQRQKALQRREEILEKRQKQLEVAWQSPATEPLEPRTTFDLFRRLAQGDPVNRWVAAAQGGGGWWWLVAGGLITVHGAR
eukprot:Skav201719  [mRNA]  locus=scaffold311:453496:457048:- [translate_table: standard]